MSRKSTLWLVSITVFVIFLTTGIKTQITVAVRSAYIEWGLAQLIIEFAKDHNGEMPVNLDDLQPYYRKGEGNLSCLESLDESVKYIRIDFDAITKLTSDPTARVFTRTRIMLPLTIRNGSTIIRDYINTAR